MAIALRDGIMVVQDLPSGVDPNKVAAMSAAIVGTSEMATRELGQGRFHQSIVDGDEGMMLSTGAGGEALLVTLVNRDANMGLVLIGVKKAAKVIASILATSNGRLARDKDPPQLGNPALKQIAVEEGDSQGGNPWNPGV